MNATALLPNQIWPEPDFPEIVPDDTVEVAFDAIGSPSYPEGQPPPVAAPFVDEQKARLAASWPRPGSDFLQWALGPGGIIESVGRGMQLLRVAAKTLPWLSEENALHDVARQGPCLQVGDVAGIRAVLIEGLRRNSEVMMESGEASFSTQLRDALDARRILDSPSFYLDGTTIGSLLDTDMPDDSIISEVRLPFNNVMVCFPAFDLVGERTELGLGRISALNGLILGSNPDGDGLAETFTAIVTMDPNTDTEAGHRADLAPLVVAVDGMWRQSVFAPVVANIAALLTWGSWDDPQPGPSLPSSSTAVRKVVRTSAFRKAVRNGTFDGTRVIDIGSVTTRRGPDQGGTHASPRAHLRRGHWRRVRVGLNGGPTTGEDAVEGKTFARVPRRIPPTIVNQGSGAVPATRTYKVNPRP